VDLEREAGDRGALDQDIETQGPEAIKILTVHSSKGLEFPYVFITNMVEGRFPSMNRRDDIEMPRELIEQKEILPESKDTHIQEERRLFYVAVTRAKKGLYITGADFYGGKRGKKPSRFLVESQLIQAEDIIPLKKEDISILEENINAQNKPEEKHEYTIPNQFSFSQISRFKKCPLQYKYQYILQIPIDKGKSHFSFGSSMHNTLYELLKRTSLGKSSQESLFEESKDKHKTAITLDNIYKIYDEKWVDDWYESKESKKHYYQAGKKILKEFYERHKDNWPNPLHLEKDFKIQLGENAIKGRIDRIDKMGDNNVEIIDYKTGKYKEKLYKDDKMQLLIYQIALEESNIKPTKLKYYFLDEKNQNETEFIAKEKDIEKTKKELEETMETIKKSDFPANPSEFNCKHCDFKNICPASAV
jgi:DNA helicase II / ATP-dependent DNA helicase PcrA